MPTSWRRFLFSIGLSIGLLLFLRQMWVGYEAIQDYEFRLLRPVYLLAALALSMFIYVLQMLAWAMIMRYLGVSLSLRQILQGFMLSFLPRYIPGSVWGYWSRSQWLEQSCGIDYTTSILGSVLETLALIVTSLSLAGMYLCTRSTGLKRFVLAGACAGLLWLTWSVMPRLAARLIDRLATRLGRESAQSHNFKKRGPPHVWLVAIALYVALWVTYGGSILLISNGVLPTPSEDLLGITVFSSLSWLLGFAVIFVPTGIGIRELSLSALLSAYSGLLPWQADLVAVISRFEIILAELGWLVVGLGLHAHKWQRGQGQPEVSAREEE